MKLIIAGEGEQGSALRVLAGELGLDGRVCFAGWLAEADSLYRACDINLLTSISETFPYAVTEGARRRLATISSRVGGIPMLVEHEKNGFLFEPGDSDALAALLTRLGNDGELRRRFGDRLYEKAAQEFSIDATISRQLSIYDAILRRARLPRRSDITVCGAYGRGNAGDDAILEAVIAELRAAEPLRRIRVLSRKPAASRRRCRVDSLYTFNIPAVHRAFRRSVLYINGGGNLIQDVTSTRSILFYLYTLWLGRRLGCRVMMYGCGIGPVSKRQNRRRAARIIDGCVDVITLREGDSADELRKLGVKRPEVILAADPALTLLPADDEQVCAELAKCGLAPDASCICFALRPWPGFEEKLDVFAEAARFAYEKYGLTSILLPVEAERDVAASRAAASRIKTPVCLLDGGLTPQLIIGILRKMRAVVSMRLHGLIFAAGAGAPLVGVSYDKKVESFLKILGQPCISLENVDVPSLCAAIDGALALDSVEIRTSVDRLRGLEHKNVEAAMRLLSEE